MKRRIAKKRSKPMLPQAHFDMGLALYRMQQYSSASDALAALRLHRETLPSAYRVAIDAPQDQAQQLLRRVLSRDFRREVQRRRCKAATRGFAKNSCEVLQAAVLAR